MEKKKGYYRIVTGKPGRPKRYATKEEIPPELLALYPAVYVEDEEEKKTGKSIDLSSEFVEGDPIKGEKIADAAVERPPAKKRGRKPKAKDSVQIVHLYQGPDMEFSAGEPIKGESPEEFGVGRPLHLCINDEAIPEDSGLKEKIEASEEREEEGGAEEAEEEDDSAPSAGGESDPSLEEAAKILGVCAQMDDKDDNTLGKYSLTQEENGARPGRRRHSRRRGKGSETEQGAEETAQEESAAPEKSDEGPETPAECTPDDVSVQSDLVNISFLLKQDNEFLRKSAEANGVRRVAEMRRSDLIYEVMRSEYAKHGFRFGKGVLDIPKGNSYGFLRRSERNYLICDDDVYVSPTQIRRFGLQKGDTIYGVFRRARLTEKSGAVIKVAAVNMNPPENKRTVTKFDDLVPQFSAERYLMEYRPDVVSTRIMDLISPIGKGQRGLIVAPPRAGKTLLLRDIANAISHNYPSVELIMLLIDERPEEVTDMQRTVKGEVVSSTFDESGDRHIQVAEMVLEKAKRLVEHGKDVVILLDSLTRLARVYNRGQHTTGKTLSGGMDAGALQKPKRFFGAARNIENGGSLTIIATVLVETGSRMDDLIYEEFKGTGNMECVLDRRISEKRVFPAIDIDRSGTRKEELLFNEEELKKVWLLRKMLGDMTPLMKAERLIEQVKLTNSNAELLMMLRER